MPVRPDTKTTIQIYMGERDALKDTLELAMQKQDKRVYYMADLIRDMNAYYRDYLESL